jgi:uncharacterized protein
VGTKAVLTTLSRDHVLVAYVALAFAFSWAWWVPVAVAGGTASHYPGLLGPMVAAVLVTLATDGVAGLRRIAGGLGRPRWWALALSPLLVGAVAAVVAHAVGNGPSTAELADMPGVPAWSWPAVFLVVLLVGGLGEEAGWRGLAWPRLRRHWNLRDAALLLTVPWAVWHLPLFWIDSGLAGMPPYVVPGWLVGLASGAVVLGWLYERSGSLAVVALAHTSVNLASATQAGEGLVAAVVSAGVIAAAVLVLRAEASRDLRSRASPGPEIRPPGR